MRGPNTSCRTSLAPVRMSPPTKLGLSTANPAGDSVEGPMARSRKPGSTSLTRPRSPPTRSPGITGPAPADGDGLSNRRLSPAAQPPQRGHRRDTPQSPPDHLTDGGSDHCSHDHVPWIVHPG